MTDHPPDERGLELRELFFETSQELLQALNDEALKLEKKPGDEEIVRVIRRTVHTLKGDSAACGMRELSELAHKFEDALSLEGTATQAAVAEIAFAAADVFTEMIGAYRSGGKLPSTKHLSQRINQLTAPATAPAQAVQARSASPGSSRPKTTGEKSTSLKSAGRKSVRKVSAGKKSVVKASTRKKSAGKTASAKRTSTKTTKSKKVATRTISARATSAAAISAATAETSSEAKAPTTKTSTARAAATVAAHWTEYEKLAMHKAQSAGLSVYHVVVKIDPHCAMPIAGRQLIHNALGAVGQVIAVHPDAKSPAASKQGEFVLASTQTVAQISAKGKIPTIAEAVTVEQILAPSLEPHKPAEEAGLAPEPAEEETLPESAAGASDVSSAAAPTSAIPAVQENLLRVEASRIDSVLNLVGELIIGKSMLQQALNEFSKRYPKELLRGKFSDAMAFQARVLNDLQRSVMKIRMVPVDQLFRRFPRMVRDVARQCGREVELAVSGQDTDLDKGILDAIAEPLTHLVRNAISHGIESPEERRKSGKSPRGTVRLNAYHHGNQVVVEVTDDGRGIDAQKIRAKAIELGMTTADESSRLSEAEVLDFIFRPGFSTAEQVTEVSGRGVGMDVVQSVLHRLKASVSLEARLGEGTTFRLKLPLTLAIIKALLFWVEERLYAIPLNAVLEIARTFEAEVHQVDNYEVLQLRNQVLPLLRLGRPAAEGDRKSKLFVLVITVGERKYGLIVDALEGEEELVIKALDDQTFSTDLVSGASILGNGRVVLILNLPAVVEHAAKAKPDDTGRVNSGLLLTHTDRMRMAMTAMASGTGGQA